MDSKTLHKFELVLVLGVAFRSAWIGSAYAGLAARMRLSMAFRNVEIIQALTTQTVALAVLAYVLYRQGRSFRQIGFCPRWRDVPASLLIAAGAYAVFYGVYLTGYYGCYFLTGRPVDLHAASTLLTSGTWTWWLLLVALLNPFFEELIVRAYTMSELRALGAGTAIPVVVSVALQTSYHLYQGPLNATALAGYFLVLAIYFHRSGRIFPVILAHLYSDVFALLRSAHH